MGNVDDNGVGVKVDLIDLPPMAGSKWPAVARTRAQPVPAMQIGILIGMNKRGCSEPVQVESGLDMGRSSMWD